MKSWKTTVNNKGLQSSYLLSKSSYFIAKKSIEHQMYFDLIIFTERDTLNPGLSHTFSDIKEIYKI